MNKNIFSGDSYKAQYANILYKRLKSRKWFSFQDIVGDFYQTANKKSPTKISLAENYGELKKAMGELKKLICGKVGENSIEEEGNNRNKSFRYTGNDPDPLADLVNATMVMNIKDYYQFCLDSAGLLPPSWLEHYLGQSIISLDLKNKRRENSQYISSSIGRHSEYIDFIPKLYDAIKDKHVLSIEYQEAYDNTSTLTFHPQLITEFNMRWFLFGFCEEHEEYGFDMILSFDRIKEFETTKKEYRAADKDHFPKYFRNIVGVTHDTQNGWAGNDRVVTIRAYEKYMFNLIKTKPIHPSQQIAMEYDEQKGFGEFILHVELNHEFIGRVLQMGEGLEIISPQEFRDVFAAKVRNMAKRYE